MNIRFSDLLLADGEKEWKVKAEGEKTHAKNNGEERESPSDLVKFLQINKTNGLI